MRQIIFALSIFISTISIAQQNSFLTIDGKSYDISEFNYIYTKNNADASYEDDSLLAYVQKYFIDYKLKINEAKRLGYDTIPKLVNELKQYRNQLSRPYLIDKEKNQSLIEEAYDRTINEVRASHILVRVLPDASPKDSLAAYERIMRLRDKIVNGGQDFNDIAAGPGGSEDQSAKSNRGDLGYFGALQMVYPFEEVAFNTEIGEVSMPVRTQFGYHIVKVTDKRKTAGKIQTAHIMIINDPASQKVDAGKEKIDEIYGLLKSGGDFSELAKKYSDDQSSKAKGGLLPEFGAGTKQRMVPSEFEKAWHFQLRKMTVIILNPFKTAFGWHIVKRMKLTPEIPPVFDKMQRELKLKVEKDARSQTTQQVFVEKLKENYNFKEDKSLIKSLKQTIGESVFDASWKYVSNDSTDETLISFADKSYKLSDFSKHIEDNQRREKPRDMDNYLNYKYNTWVNKVLLDYEDSMLESKYPAFKNLMREYEEGVLIFEIMQNEVWNKASQDTVGLKAYYEKHKMNYIYPERYAGTLYKVKDKAIAKNTLKMLKTTDLSDKEIEDSLNVSSKLNVDFKSGNFNADSKEFLTKKAGKYRKFKEGKSKIFVGNDGQYYVFKADKYMETSIRKFGEARGLATAGYQVELQETWMKDLRENATIDINKDILFKAETFK